jgi:hypothetical protein
MQVDALRVVTGPEAVKAMHSVNQEQRRRDGWPYPWAFPPESAEPVFRVGSVVTPAYLSAGGAETEVLRYDVPAGLQFALCGLVQIYVGAGFVPGSGDMYWTVDQDSPVGIIALMANPLPGLFQVPIPLGGFVGPNGALGGIAAPWVFPKPFILKPETQLRSKVTTIQNVSTGTANYCISVFSGFTWPA